MLNNILGTKVAVPPRRRPRPADPQAARLAPRPARRRGVRRLAARGTDRPKGAAGDELLGKGQMGSALMGSLQFLCFLSEGLFGYSR